MNEGEPASFCHEYVDPTKFRNTCFGNNVALRTVMNFTAETAPDVLHTTQHNTEEDPPPQHKMTSLP